MDGEHFKMTEPVGIVFMYDKAVGDVQKVTDKLKPFLTEIVRNLVGSGYIKGKDEFERIFDGEFVYFSRLAASDLKKMMSDESLIANTALDVYKYNTEVEANEEVNALHYPKEESPWGFDLLVAVVYAI